MHVTRTRRELAAALATAPRPVGLVPTMGWLHDGHRSLIRRSRADSATTIVTIFVNPRQFDDPADLGRYPRDEARDLALCEAEGVELVFAPPADEVYPAGFDTTVRVGALAARLEGAARPGHLDGVATVVAVLLNLVRAERAYFGRKDAQQLLVVRRLAADLAIGTEVVGCPIVREPDGLALSSRNVHLDPAERTAATVLHRSLRAGLDAFDAGERDAEALRAAVGRVLAGEPLAEVDYVSCADAATLKELVTVDEPALLSLAVRIGSTRLIDNEFLELPVSGTAGPA